MGKECKKNILNYFHNQVFTIFLNIPISRIFLNEGDESTLILVMYFPLEDLNQTHNYDPRNPLVMNLEQKQQIPDFLFSKTYYCVLLVASVAASITTYYFIYKCTKKTIRKCKKKNTTN